MTLVRVDITNLTQESLANLHVHFPPNSIEAADLYMWREMSAEGPPHVIGNKEERLYQWGMVVDSELLSGPDQVFLSYISEPVS